MALQTRDDFEIYSQAQAFEKFETIDGGGLASDPITGLNITLLTTVYYPDPTGTSVYATEVAEHLASLGNNVHVVTAMPHYPQWEIHPDYKGSRRRTEHHNGVQIDRLWLYVPEHQSLLRRAVYEGSFALHALADRKLEGPKPDLVIAFMPNVANGIIGRHWARRAGAPLILLVQDLSGTGAEESGMQGGCKVAGLVSSVEFGVAKSASVVTVCSNTFRRGLEKGGVSPERITEFPNWSRLPEPHNDRAAERARRGWAPTDQIVLHAGNIGMKQGMELVADYARQAAVTAPHLRFVMVGDGSQRREVEALTEGMANVSFIPPVPEDELPDLLAAADVLFLHERPGLKEMSVPSKCTAYFSVARPVVAAVEADGPAAGLIHASGGGVVTPAGDAVTLVDVLEKLASDPDRAARLGRAGRAYAEAEMSREAAMVRLHGLVDRALGRQPKKQPAAPVVIDLRDRAPRSLRPARRTRGAAERGELPVRLIP